MTDIKSPEDKIAAAILTLASALRDQNLVTDGSLENIFGFYRRFLEAVRTGRVASLMIGTLVAYFKIPKILNQDRLVRRPASVFLTNLRHFWSTAKFACGYMLRGIAPVHCRPYNSCYC